MTKDIRYANTSPYANTRFFDNFLDVWKPREVPAALDDRFYTIEAVYKWRPDLLSFDLYETSKLWWVFAVRNPNALKDPVFDFIPGKKIFLPDKAKLFSALGV